MNPQIEWLLLRRQEDSLPVADLPRLANSQTAGVIELTNEVSSRK